VPLGNVVGVGRATRPAMIRTGSCRGRSSTNRAPDQTVPALEFLDGCLGAIDLQFQGS